MQSNSIDPATGTYVGSQDSLTDAPMEPVDMMDAILAQEQSPNVDLWTVREFRDRPVSQFEVRCEECGVSIGVTDCEIVATSMTLCQPCEDQD